MAAASAPKSAETTSVGAKCEVKALYNHTPESKHTQWSEFDNITDEEDRIKNLGKDFAVVHRMTKVDKESGEFAWITHSIEAQGPRLRKALDQIFSDYPSWYPDGKPYAVSPPFKPYIHRWDEISASLRHQDTSTKTELQLLRRELQKHIEPHLGTLKKIKDSGAVEFELLWLILAPGCLMLSRESGNLSVSVLRSAQLIPKRRNSPAYWFIEHDQIDWDGSATGFKRNSTTIYEYKESTLVIKLGIYPLQFDPNHKEITGKVLARGRIFETLRGFHVKTCNTSKFIMKLDPHRNCFREIEKPVGSIGERN
jgi:hypothetical protein